MAIHAVAPDPAVFSHRLRRQLRDSHGVALAQERLPKDTGRSEVHGRAPSTRGSAGRLHGSPALEHSGNAFTGICRKDEARSGNDAYGDAEWPVRDGQESRTLVSLLRCCWNLRGVCRRNRVARRRALPSRFPVRRCYRVYRILGGSVADVDLVSARLAPDDQSDGGRVDLRVADRRHIRLAVAAIDRSARSERSARQRSRFIGGAGASSAA